MTKRQLENIEELNRKLLQMATQTEDLVRQALDALINQNIKAARLVILRDEEIDNLENEINAHILSSLTQHSPIEVDIRLFLAGQKINNDLERVADHAVNIAEAAIALSDSPHIKPLVNIPKMAEIVVEMLEESIDAFVERDMSVALKVHERDDEIDQLEKIIKRTLSKIIQQQPENFDRAVHLIGIATDLERIADLATNIAEEAFFITEARVMKHKT